MLAKLKVNVERYGVQRALRRGVLSRLMWLADKLPDSAGSQRLFHWFNFIRYHGRPPSRRPGLNDTIYRMKVSGEMGSELLVRTSDKELVKRFVADTVGERYHVPTIAVLKSAVAVHGYDFPERCVIKPTHSTGLKILREQGEPIDLATVASWFDHDRYAISREPHYKGLERKVIVEPLLDATGQIELFCHRGRVRVIQHKGPWPMRLFSPEWVDLRTSFHRPLDGPANRVPVPESLSEICRVASALSTHFSFVRVDVYYGVEGGRFMVGELTHCTANGGYPIPDRAHERYVGNVLFGSDPAVSVARPRGALALEPSAGDRQPR